NSVLMREWISIILLMITVKSTSQHEDVNGVVGDPLVDCGEGHITISFDTEAPFKGLVFVRNKLEEPECRSPPADEHWYRNTSIRIQLTDCGTERRLSMDPPGMFVTTNIVVAFHPQFLTKHDRVYQVMCYYMAMERTEERTIKISMPGPKLQTAVVPMPICKYEVLDKTPFGPPVHYAQIGQMIYHKWTCETETKDTFCMVVHSCTVDDGDGNKVELLDQKGCAHDKYLLQNLEYTSDLMAGKEAHVYKYADKAGIFFECQISITVKEPDQEYCDVPVCPDPPRRRRSHFLNETEGRYETLTMTSDSSNSSVSSIELIGVSNGDTKTSQKWDWIDEVARIDKFNNVCLSRVSTWIFAGSNALILLLAILSSRHSVQIMLTPPRKEIWFS
ncbi:hypothetical protein PMAYCL1PPCAC_30902, partial [Pristionchus mayeri]